MSYNKYGTHSVFSPYDLWALHWIYGGDGVKGTYGIGGALGPSLPPDAYPPITHTLSGGSSASEASASYSFTVTRAGNVAVATTVAWAVGGGVDAADFGGTLPSGVVSFAAGETTKTVNFSASNDNTIEANEAFSVTLGARTGNGAVLGEVTSASYTLLDDDTPPVVSISAGAAEEGNSGSTSLVFVVSRSGNLGQATELQWNFAHGSTNTADFAGGNPPASGRLTVQPGQATAQISFQIAGDTTIEGNETFLVDITPLSFGSAGETRAVGTIVSDDVNNRFSLSAVQAQVPEGASGSERTLEFLVSRSGDSSAAATVSWERSGSIQSDDLKANTPTGGQISFGAGQTQQTLRLTLTGDSRFESDEALTVTLLGADGLGAGLGSVVQASTTVQNDDPKGEVTVRALTPASVSEGNSGSVLHRFTLTRNGDLSDGATMNWRISGDVNAADFGGTLPSGVVTFAAGAATATANIEVSTRGDALYEQDERLTLTLDEGARVVPSPTGGSATVLLLNDDVPNEVTIRAVNPLQNEGSAPGIATGYQFEVKRIGDLSQGASVDVQLQGAGPYPANAQDFKGGALPAFKLSLPAGQSATTFWIEVAQDSQREADESFRVNLLNGQGVSVSETQGSADATIRTDEAAPVLSVSAPFASVAEGSIGLQAISFTLTRTSSGGSFAELDQAATVTWSLGGSTDAADLLAGQARSGSVVFDAFQASKTVTVQLQGDTAVEAHETLVLRLDSVQGGAVLSPTLASATVTVQNDDNPLRSARGTAAPNEKIVLQGARADYAITLEPATGTHKLVDQVQGRDGEINASAIEVFAFSDALIKALPSDTELQIVQLGQTVLGAGGLSGAQWAFCQTYVAEHGTLGLAGYAAELAFGALGARDMAQTVLRHLGLSAGSLSGDNPQAAYAWTENLLTDWFSGGPAQRAEGLLMAATALRTLEADPSFGAAARNFNDRVGAEWLDEFAADPVTLAGLPDELLWLPLPQP